MSAGKKKSKLRGDSIGFFLHDLMAARNVSPHTLAAYRADLTRFNRWREIHGPVSPDELRLEDLTRYVGELSECGLASSSIARHLASLSSYFRFLVEIGKLKENVAELLNAPKIWERLPTVLSPSAVDRLLNAPSTETRLGRRDRAALETLYATGCRASEVVGLRPIDLDLKAGTARCIGKGDKQRLVLLGTRARRELEAYLTRDRPILTARRPETVEIFVSRSGRPLSRMGLWRIVKNHARNAGLSNAEQVSPHALRHSFATHMLAGGADLRVVQELLGHSSIATTQIYTRVEISRLMKTHQDFHPRNKIFGRSSPGNHDPES